MRVSVPRTLVALALAGASLAAAHPAAAQNYTPPGQLPQYTVRVGAFFSGSSVVRHTVGSTSLAAGLDYDVHQEVGTSRTIFSVDYIDRSSGGNDFRMFPVTVGQLVMGSASNNVEPYYGFGTGAYFIHQDFGGTQRHDDVRFGGYVAAGLIYDHYLDLDVRYHLVTSQNNINPSGLELTAGVRF